MLIKLAIKNSTSTNEGVHAGLKQHFMNLRLSSLVSDINQRIETFSFITFNSPFHAVECYNFAVFDYISN